MSQGTEIVPFRGGTRDQAVQNQTRFLATRLAGTWRSPTDSRDSSVETCHRRSGTSLGVHTIEAGRDDPASVARLCVGDALEFMGSQTSGQGFDVVLDGTRVATIWLTPESGDSMGTNESIVSQLLQKDQAQTESFMQQTNEMMRTYNDQLKEWRGVVGDALRAQFESAKTMGEIYRAEKLMEIEAEKAKSSEKRVDGLFSLIQQGVGAAAPEVMDSLRGKLGKNPLEKLYAAAGPIEKEFLAMMALRAQARAKAEAEGKDPEAAANAATPELAVIMKVAAEVIKQADAAKAAAASTPATPTPAADASKS